MNKIYKLVWSKVRSAWVVTSEIAKGHGKDSSSGRDKTMLKAGVVMALLGGFMTAGISPVAAELTQDQQAVYDAVMANLVKKMNIRLSDNNIVAGRDIEVYGGHNAVFGTDYSNLDNKLTKVAGKNNTVIGVGNLVGYTATLDESDNKTWIYKKKKYGDDQNVAVGMNNTVNGGSIAIGTSSEVMSLGTSVGHGNEIISQSDYGLALGNDLTVDGDQSIAVGSHSKTTADRATAIGQKAMAKANYTTAIGQEVIAEKAGSVAIGMETKAITINGVALGSYSVADRAKGAIGYLAGDKTSKAWKSNVGALSIGGGEYDVTRQITGVAAGSEDTDAVNVAQLKALDNKVADQLKDADGVHYFSVNSDDKDAPDGTNWKNDGATGEDAIAIGKKAVSEGPGSIAIGKGSKVFNTSTSLGMAIGDGAEASHGSIVIGKNARDYDTDPKNGAFGVYIGLQAKSLGGSSQTVIGNYGQAKGQGSTAIGSKAYALGGQSSAVGENSQALQQGAAAFGAQSIAEFDDSTALGSYANGRGNKSVASGNKSVAAGHNSVAIGYQSFAHNGFIDEDAYKALSPEEQKKYFKASGMNAYFLKDAADGNDAEKIGDTYLNTAVGSYSRAYKQGTTLGGMTSAKEEGTAIGTYAKAYKKGAASLGYRAQSNAENGVALGAYSFADREKGAVGYLAGNKETEEWKSTLGAVSIGKTAEKQTRQITNVAAGSKDTDAVNVAQLKAVNNKADKLDKRISEEKAHYFSVSGVSRDDRSNYHNNATNGVEKSLAIGEYVVANDYSVAIGYGAKNNFDTEYKNGQPVKRTHYYSMGLLKDRVGSPRFNGEWAYEKIRGSHTVAIGDRASTNDTMGIAIGYKASAGKLGTNNAVAPQIAVGALAEASGSSTIAVGEGATAEMDSSIAIGTGAYAKPTGGEDIHSIAFGTYSRSEATESMAFGHHAKALTNRSIAIGAGSEAKVSSGVALGYSSVADRARSLDPYLKGEGKVSDTVYGTLGAVSIGNPYGDRLYDNIRVGWYAKKGTRQLTNLAAGSEDTDAVNVAQLKVVNAKADKNATDITNLQNTVNVNGKATKVTVDGKEENTDGNLKITKKTKDGQTTYDLSLNDELTIGKDGKDGKIGINGKDGKSADITVGKGEAGVDGKDGITRIIYKDEKGNHREVATLDDGLKFKGDAGDMVIRKLNTQLNITGGAKADELSEDNIGVVGTAGDNGGMKVKLSKNLKGLTSAEFKDGDNVTNITAGNVTITRKEGKVDLWELNNTVNNITTGKTDVSSWKLQANGANERTITKDSVVNFKNGTNTEVTVNGNDITVDLNKTTKDQINDNTTNISNIDKRVTTIEKNIDQKIEGAKVTVEGDATTGVKVEKTAEDGKPVNYKVSLENKVNVGNVAIDGKDGKGEITGLTNTTVDAADFATKGRAATEEQLKQAMAKTQEASRTTVKGSGNITVTPTTAGASEYTVGLAKDISVDSVTAKEYKVGDKTYINEKGINANGNKITNVADGKVSADSTDAVNGRQLYEVSRQIEKSTMGNVQRELSAMGDRVDRVGAGAAALAALHPMDFDPDDKWDFAAGYGHYKGANALAIGAFYRPNENKMFSVGGSFGGGENMLNVGFSMKVGKGNEYMKLSRPEMAQKLEEQSKEIQEMKAKDQERDAQMQEIMRQLELLQAQAAK